MRDRNEDGFALIAVVLGIGAIVVIVAMLFQQASRHGVRQRVFPQCRLLPSDFTAPRRNGR